MGLHHFILILIWAEELLRIPFKEKALNVGADGVPTDFGFDVMLTGKTMVIVLFEVMKG